MSLRDTSTVLDIEVTQFEVHGPGEAVGLGVTGSDVRVSVKLTSVVVELEGVGSLVVTGGTTSQLEVCQVSEELTEVLLGSVLASVVTGVSVGTGVTSVVDVETGSELHVSEAVGGSENTGSTVVLEAGSLEVVVGTSLVVLVGTSLVMVVEGSGEDVGESVELGIGEESLDDVVSCPASVETVVLTSGSVVIEELVAGSDGTAESGMISF